MKTPGIAALVFCLALALPLWAAPLESLAAQPPAVDAPQSPAVPESAAAPALPPVSSRSAPQAAAGAAPEQGAPKAAAPLPDINLSWGGYFQALGILCLALAALWALLWLLKRKGGLGGVILSGSPAMRIESRLALGPKKWILVVRCLDRRLVIGVTDQNMTLLTEMYDGPEEARPEEKRDSGKADAPGLHFASFLKKDKKTPDQDPA